MSKIEEPGRYPATVTTAEIGESRNGTPFLSLTFVTEDKNYITGWLYLSDKAIGNSLKTLRDAFGFDGEFETVEQQIAGKPCSITCEFEEFEGKDTLKVKWINAPRVEIADKVSFLKSLTQKAARIPAKASPASAPTRATPAARPALATNRAVGQAPEAPVARQLAAPATGNQTPGKDEDVPF